MTAIIMKFDFECEGGMKQCGKRFGLGVTIFSFFETFLKFLRYFTASKFFYTLIQKCNFELTDINRILQKIIQKP